MRIKVTGINDLSIAFELIKAGVDALVFDFSKPKQNPESIRELILKLPPMIFKSGHFSNLSKHEIEELATFCKLDLLEFSGSRLDSKYRGFSQPVIRHLNSSAELMINWSKLNIAMLQIPLGLYIASEISFFPVVVDLEVNYGQVESMAPKPYAINLNYTGSKGQLEDMLYLIKALRATS